VTLAITFGMFVAIIVVWAFKGERYLMVPVCLFAALCGAAIDGLGRRTPRRIFAGVALSVFLAISVFARAGAIGDVHREAGAAAGWYGTAQALVDRPGVRDALNDCDRVAVASAAMMHFFSYYSGRPADRIAVDDRGATRPDVFVAPVSAAVRSLVLTRARFDEAAAFEVPRALRAGPRNRDWALFVAPGAPCARGLL
jgi:hypothetical protein